ncbi:hypothetical protein ACH5RR_003541 [Cinchona calisaya]|uniref:Uncharacterized protein n=1 Tax=Cinchona calisaya TaxID=153742 RepID=A0ABD3AV59_9GENT
MFKFLVNNFKAIKSFIKNQERQQTTKDNSATSSHRLQKALFPIPLLEASVFDRIGPNPMRMRDSAIEVEGENSHDDEIKAKVDQRVQELLGRKTIPTLELLIVDKDPFTPTIQNELIMPNLKQPNLDIYKGTTDPTDHIAHVSLVSKLFGYSDAITCKLFATTLKESA